MTEFSVCSIFILSSGPEKGREEVRMKAKKALKQALKLWKEIVLVLGAITALIDQLVKLIG